MKLPILKCKIINGDRHDKTDLIEIKLKGICEDCAQEGYVWFIEGDEQVGLCDDCLKTIYYPCKIVYFKEVYRVIYNNEMNIDFFKGIKMMSKEELINHFQRLSDLCEGVAIHTFKDIKKLWDVKILCKEVEVKNGNN